LHVLYFHQHFSTPRGFTGTRSYEMAQALIRRGHQVTLVCGSYDMAKTGLTGPVIKNKREGNIDGIHVIELFLPYANKDSFLKRSWTFVRFAMRSVLLAWRTPYDLLFASSTPLTSGIPGIFMRVLKGRKPIVFEVRDLWPELPREMKVITNPLILWAMSVLEWLSYHSAGATVGLSPGIEAGIQRRGIAASRTTMIPNGSDLDLFRPNPEKKPVLPGLEPGRFVAAFTGAHGIANGLAAVLDAAAVLKQKERDDITLVFIGDGKKKPGLVERAKREGLDNCLFYDPIDKTELAELLPRFDAGLMILDNVPAFYYGTSPNKFFDYIAAGLPVLNNYPGWLADLIGEAGCGIPVKPADPEAFAEALIQLADQEDQRVEMGARARVLAETEFDRHKLANQWVDFIEAQSR